jgi:hypothetical protein
VAKQVQSEADRIAAEELANNPVAPKGRATPTRKEREAQRKRPLVGAKTPEARALSKDQQRAQLDRARIGRANGEEKYLPVRDRGPQKRFARDYIDARWSFAELFLPVIMVALIVQLLIPSTAGNLIQYGEYGFIALVAIDLIILTVQLRRAMTRKFGADKVERLGLYPVTRAIYFRRLRVPKPLVKRGDYPS